MAPTLKARSRRLWIRLRDHPLLLWAQRTGRGFRQDHCLVHASALTYATLLALVPLLAVLLAMLKGAGFGDNLRPFLLGRFPVLGAEIIDQLLAYINRANTQAVGGIGLALLLLSAWTMLSNIENALNHIFCVSRARGYVRRAGEYLSMLVVGAVVIVLSIVLQTVLGSPTLFARLLGSRAGEATHFALLLLPWASTWAGFAFLYSWMPNARIDFRTAALGGLVGGTLFQFVQLGYIELQLGFARYHAIYGALAQLPIVLVWVYLSWVVVLVGAEAASARRAARVPPDRARAAAPAIAADPASLALFVLRSVADAFRAGLPTPGALELAARLGISAREVRTAVAPLLRGGILVEPEEPQGYLPSSSLSAVSFEQVLAALRETTR